MTAEHLFGAPAPGPRPVAGRLVDVARLGRCGSCDATVGWVLTEARGRPMPLDVEPVDHGTVALLDTPAGPLARVHGHGRVPPGAGPLYTAHQATCPRGSGDPWLHRRHRPKGTP